MDQRRLTIPSKRTTVALATLFALMLGLDLAAHPVVAQELELTAPLVEPVAPPSTPPRKLSQTAGIAILTTTDLPILTTADFPQSNYVPSIVGEMVSFRDSIDLDDFGFGSEPTGNQPPPLDRGPIQEETTEQELDLDELMKTDPVPPATVVRKNYHLKPIVDITFKGYEDKELDEDETKGPPPIYPEDRSLALLESQQLTGPPAIDSTAYWVAPNLYYQPLLWEDPLLERYGQSARPWGLQPIRSGVHFTVDSALAPLRAYKYRCQWETPLAFERPGSCPQPVHEIAVPLN